MAHPLHVFVVRCSFTSDDVQRWFVAFQFAHPMTQKWLNLAKELGKYWKMFSDRYMLGDERFYPISGDTWVTNTLKNINSSQPRGSPWWGRTRSKGPVVLPSCFSFKEVRRFVHFGIFDVLKMFPWHSQYVHIQVLNVFS
jgi:hypothetical protein